MSYAPILQTPTVVVPVTFTEKATNKKATIKVAFKRYLNREKAAGKKEELLKEMRKDLWLRMPAPEKLELDDPKRKELPEDYLEWMDSYSGPASEEEKHASSEKIKKEIIEHIVYFEDVTLMDIDTDKEVPIKSTQEHKVKNSSLKQEEWEEAGFSSATAFVADIYMDTFWGPEIANAFLDTLTNQSSSEEAKRKN